MIDAVKQQKDVGIDIPGDYGQQLGISYASLILAWIIPYVGPLFGKVHHLAEPGGALGRGDRAQPVEGAFELRQGTVGVGPHTRDQSPLQTRTWRRRSESAAK